MNYLIQEEPLALGHRQRLSDRRAGETAPPKSLHCAPCAGVSACHPLNQRYAPLPERPRLGPAWTAPGREACEFIVDFGPSDIDVGRSRPKPASLMFVEDGLR